MEFKSNSGNLLDVSSLSYLLDYSVFKSNIDYISCGFNLNSCKSSNISS